MKPIEYFSSNIGNTIQYKNLQQRTVSILVTEDNYKKLFTMQEFGWIFL